MISSHRSDRNAGRILLVPLLLIIFVAMSLSACGKKADPLPPAIPKPEAVSGLKIQKTSDGILLQWPPGPPDIWKIKILRREMAKGDCPGCPNPIEEFRPLAELTRDGKGSASETVFSQYTDRDVKAGNFYRYRIVACGREGMCSDESDIAEIGY